MQPTIHQPPMFVFIHLNFEKGLINKNNLFIYKVYIYFGDVNKCSVIILPKELFQFKAHVTI